MSNYNRSPSEIILHLLTFSGLLMSGLVNGRLLKTLEDTVVLVNDSMRLTCQSNISEEIHFYHNNILMYAGGIFYKPYKGRFNMDTTGNNTYALVNGKAGPEDAGVYKCWDEESRGQPSSADLTVLNTRLLCETNMNAGGYIGPNTCNLQHENMIFGCSVSFNGKPPRLVWRASDDNRLINSSVCDHQLNRVNCRLTLTSGPSYDGTIFTCQTAQPSGSQYNCSTGVIKVQYFIKDHDLKPVEKRINDEVTCSVKTNQNLRYNWTQLQDNDHVLQSSNKTYVIRNSGLYWCSATYIIKGGVTCHTLVSVVHVQNEEALTVHQNSTTFAAIMSITLVALIAMSIAVLIDKIKKSSTKKWKFARKLQLKDSKKPIYGIAILNDELFSISKNDSKFEVYSTKENFPHIRSCSVKGLTTPKDIISCRYKNCLFIKDCIKGDTKTGDNEASENIFRVSTTGHVEKKWKIDGDTGQISISGTCNVLVPSWNGSKLLEFTYNGERVGEIRISPEAEITCLRQAILIDCRYFVLIHGDDSKEKHRVCTLDLSGNLMKVFGNMPGKSTSQVHLPSHLVVDECNSIIVADRKNNRLLLLSSQLDLITAVHLDTSKEHKLIPWRLCLNIENSMLIVSDNAFEESTGDVVESRILVYSATVGSPSNQKS